MKADLKKNIENYLIDQKNLTGDTLFIEKKVQHIKDIAIPEKSLNNNNSNDIQVEKKEVRILDDASSIFNKEDWLASESLEELYDKIHECQKCPLGQSRTNFVFGTGNPNADIMFIGEAPGADEDAQGKPFVGKAGQLLTKIIESIDLTRDEVFIANILKCRPPNNRTPDISEVEKCENYLLKQIELIKPAFIILLGATAADSLLKKKHKMADARGNILEYHGCKLMITYHPAALLYNASLKKDVWEDMKMLRRLYNEYLNNSKIK